MAGAFGSFNTEFFLMPHLSYWIYDVDATI